MDQRVLDAFALLAWLQGEPAAPSVRKVLQEGEEGVCRVHMSVINAGEVYYRLQKTGHELLAEKNRRDLQRKKLPIKLEAAGDRMVWQAAKLKATFRLSYADAFAVGLSQELRALLLTCDPEILALPPETVAVQALPRRR